MFWCFDVKISNSRISFEIDNKSLRAPFKRIQHRSNICIDRQVGLKQNRTCQVGRGWGIHRKKNKSKWVSFCVTRAPLLYFIRTWVVSSSIFQSLSVSQWVSHPWHLSRSPLVQYIKAEMPSTHPVSSITNCHRLIVSYTDPVHSFIIS